MADLPDGFSVDQQAQPGSGNLPEGFSVDQSQQEQPGFLEKTWNELKGPAVAAASQLNQSFNPYSDTGQAYIKHQFDPNASTLDRLGNQWQQFKNVGSGLAAVPALAASPFTGVAHATLGQGLEAINQRKPGDPGYVSGDDQADLAMMGLSPKTASPIGIRPPIGVTPPTQPPSGPLGVTLSKGQETGELPLIRREQAALRGQLGPQAEAQAADFAAQQKQQVADARDAISSGFDPFGQQIAQGPQESGAIISDSLKAAAASAKSGVRAQYSAAQAFPGEIHASAFEGIGNAIKNDLTTSASPVIIDDKLTPYASAAIGDIDKNVANLNIPNRADPYGQPNPENIVGVNLQGVDQWRKRLSAFRSQAYQSGNAADGRATQAVLDAFDDHVDRAVNSGLFNGDPRAVDAWNDARAANTDYRKTFTASKNDPVGRVVEKILGKGNAPSAIPNDVADFMYGTTGVNPSTLNVGVANRVKSVMGTQSPEWTSVKQGLFSRLTATPPGVTDWGPGKIAQNLNNFLNGSGKEMSQTIFSPQERTTLQSFADLQRQLEVPPTGANRSETSTFVVSALHRLSGWLGMVVGASMARVAMPFLPFGVSEGIGAGAALGAKNIAGRIDARGIANQMPLIADTIAKWNKANAAYNRANTPPSQAALGFATTNLMKSFNSIGIDLSKFQLPSPIAAQQNQQQVPGPPSQ